MEKTLLGRVMNANTDSIVVVVTIKHIDNKETVKWYEIPNINYTDNDAVLEACTSNRVILSISAIDYILGIEKRIYNKPIPLVLNDVMTQ